MQNFTPITEKEIQKKCQEDDFVKDFGYYYLQGDIMVDVANPLSIHKCKTIRELKEAFMQYDAFRQCFIYQNLVFVNSTLGGGWEAWTLKKFGEKLISFESISMQQIIKEGTHVGLTFEEYIEQLLNLTKEQVAHYLE